jgi:hypothetical protein
MTIRAPNRSSRSRAAGVPGQNIETVQRPRVDALECCCKSFPRSSISNSHEITIWILSHATPRLLLVPQHDQWGDRHPNRRRRCRIGRTCRRPRIETRGGLKQERGLFQRITSWAAERGDFRYVDPGELGTIVPGENWPDRGLSSRARQDTAKSLPASVPERGNPCFASRR